MILPWVSDPKGFLIVEAVLVLAIVVGLAGLTGRRTR